MSDFYKIQLRRFPRDTGFSGNNRPLTRSEASLRGTDTAREITGDTFAESSETVIFDVSPTISEARGAEYVDRAVPGPVGIIVYAATQNRRFSISSRFVSRNVREAATNYYYTNLLRSWMIPQATKTGSGTLGRPPILRLNGYKQQFFNIPVVVTEQSFEYPDDVDYIELPYAMVPIIQTVSISLTESHNLSISTSLGGSGNSVTDRNSSGEFDIAKFRSGFLPGY